MQGLFVLHFDGSTWTRSTISNRQVSSPLVRGSSPSDVYVAGAAYGEVFRRTPTGWKTSALPIYGAFSDVLPLGPDDALTYSDLTAPARWDGLGWQMSARWAGEYVKAAATGDGRVWATVNRTGALGLWDGARWRYVDPGVSANWWGVWASAPDNVWVAGWTARSPYVPLAARFDGTEWREVTLPASTASGAEGVFGTGPDDVWVVSYKEAFHWNGTTVDQTYPLSTSTQIRGGTARSTTEA